MCSNMRRSIRTTVWISIYHISFNAILARTTNFSSVRLNNVLNWPPPCLICRRPITRVVHSHIWSSSCYWSATWNRNWHFWTRYKSLILLSKFCLFDRICPMMQIRLRNQRNGPGQRLPQTPSPGRSRHFRKPIMYLFTCLQSVCFLLTVCSMGIESMYLLWGLRTDRYLHQRRMRKQRMCPEGGWTGALHHFVYNSSGGAIQMHHLLPQGARPTPSA